MAEDQDPAVSLAVVLELLERQARIVDRVIESVIAQHERIAIVDRSINKLIACLEVLASRVERLEAARLERPADRPRTH